MAVSMTFRTVKSRNRNWPTITGYLVTCPFCRNKPKRNPVNSPRRSLPSGSATSRLPAEDGERRNQSGGEEGREEHPAGERELERAADAVAAGAASGQSGAEHEDGGCT